MALQFNPPQKVRGMKILNREAFAVNYKVPALKIDAQFCSVILKQLSGCLLNKPRLKNIVPDSDKDSKKKIVLLDPTTSFSKKQKVLIKDGNCEEISYEIVLNYAYWSTDQILRAVLPENIPEVTTAFEAIGHIAHMNLRDCHLDYKYLIGKVILDKNSPQIKTVVNKLNTIDETYRFFKMELLAGEENMITTVKEHGCTFTLDFSKVYWNSRLQSEHKRLVDIFQKDEIVCDMFAGVGPFAIPAAKKGCVVYANDLNPNSYEALVQNCQLNHVKDKVHCYNIDARLLLKHLLKNDKCLYFDHVIMNLPATAVEFLHVFHDLYSDVEGVKNDVFDEVKLKLPKIHCYCFSKAHDPIKDAKTSFVTIGCDEPGKLYCS